MEIVGLRKYFKDLVAGQRPGGGIPLRRGIGGNLYGQQQNPPRARFLREQVIDRAVPVDG